MRARWFVLTSVLGIGLVIHAQTRAFVPAAGAGVPIFYSPAGAALANAAIGIGAVIGAIGILGTPSDSQPQEKLMMPAAIKDVPQGWSPNADPTQPPMPPATANPTHYWRVDSPVVLPGPYDSADAAAAAGCANANRSGPLYCGGATAGFYACTEGGAFSCANPPYTSYGQVTQQSTCPAGYGSDGSGGCVVTNPDAVRYPVDNQCGLKFSAGTMSFDSRDPDCDGSPPPGVSVSSDGKTWTSNGTAGASGTTVTVNANGSITIRSAQPQPDGTTKIDTWTIANPSAGPAAVTQTSSSAVTGQGPDARDAAGNPIGSPVGDKIQFPDDYAREGTQQTAVQRLTQIEDALTKTDSAAPADPTPKAQSDIESVFFPGTFQGLLSWQLPARTVACPTWSFSLWGQTYTIDAQCTLIEQQRATMSAICLLVYGLVALFIVLGA